MPVLRVDVQVVVVLVVHVAVKSLGLQSLALEKGLDRTLEFAALLHAPPLLLKCLVKKQLDRWGAVDSGLFRDLLISFDVNFDALSLSIEF